MGTRAGGSAGSNEDGFTDDDLLGGEQDEGEPNNAGGNRAEDDDGTGLLDGLDDDTPEAQNPGNDSHLRDDPGDDLQIEILDSDEGSADGAEARGGQDTEQDLNPDTGEDTGEEIGQDFLTEWEKKNYSKAMQGRVTRERRLKKDAEDRASSEQAARIAAEQRALEAEKVTVKLLVKTFERDIADKTAALIKAKEDGETKTEVELTQEIADLREKKRFAEQQGARLDAVPDPKESAKQPLNPLAQRWLGRNRWMANAAFQAEAAEARRIDQEIFAEGRLRPDTVEYFAEMDRRIRRSLPNLQRRVAEVYGTGATSRTDRPGGRPAGQPPVRRTPPSGGGGSRPNKVVITPSDKANMRKFGLDPNDKKALREYALSKLARGEG